MTNLKHTLTHLEPDSTMTSGKLNWLRAAVLGANDGIVSVSSVIVGVAGALPTPRVPSSRQVWQLLSQEHSLWQSASMYQSVHSATQRKHY